MSGVANCANHPTKRATHTCQQCGKPLCPACVSHTDMGTLCGRECYATRKEFRERVALNSAPAKRMGIDFGKAAKGLLIFLLLVGVLYGVFFFVYGDKTPDDIRQRVDSWIRTAKGP